MVLLVLSQILPSFSTISSPLLLPSISLLLSSLLPLYLPLYLPPYFLPYLSITPTHFIHRSIYTTMDVTLSPILYIDYYLYE